MSNTALAPAGVVLGLIALLAACGSAPATDDHEAGPLAMTEIAGGSHSAILEPQVRIARTPKEWAELWAAHSASSIPARPAPSVDFDSEMVIGVFLGQRTSSGYGIEVRSCLVGNGRVNVRAQETRPDPSMVQAAVMTSPFRFVLVPRAEGQATLELAESTSD